jgi:hypothetical protein
MLAAHHTSLAVHGNDGLVVRIGDLKSPVTQRLLTRSSHIELGASHHFVSLVSAWLGSRGKGTQESSLLPAKTLLPLFPTFLRRAERLLTTTHYAYGAGHPQLVFAFGDDTWDGNPPRTFDLDKDRISIGSSPESDLVIEGAEPFHAEIRHLENDEYVLFPVAKVGTGIDPKYTVAEWAQGGVILRTGARIQIGGCKMAFFRKEYADHGRPFAGRSGGEWSHQRPQLPRKIYSQEE